MIDDIAALGAWALRRFAGLGFGFRFLTRIPFSVLFLVCAFALFPGWFATRTVAGATAYLAVLLYFFSKGWPNTRP